MKERSHPGLQQYALLCAAAMSVAAALLLLFWTLLFWSRWHPHLPWRDVFVILDDLQPILSGDGNWRSWSFLFEAHYSAHRITLPRLLVFWDLTLLSGRGHLLYATAWAGLLVIVALYVRLARDYFRADQAIAWFCGGILGILMFAPAHAWNSVNAINSSWHLSFAFGALAFFLLVKKSDNASGLDWLMAYGLATVAAFTTFAGVIVWLLLPVIALSSGRRVLLITVVCSTLLTLAYLNGIASDADIAAAWDAGDPTIAASIQEVGRAALEQNSLLRIAQGASKVLCWPMSSEHPLLAAVFFVLSLVALFVGWIQFLRAARVSQRLAPWVEWCLLLATMALGVALAIQLGRMIEQPNHAHGPSYERYNTVVALYWLGIISLVMAVVPRMPAVCKGITMLVVMLMVSWLLVPSGSYLQQEIGSLETAARLYAEGETPELREEVDGRLLRFKPEYVFTFDPLFESRQLAYRRPVQFPTSLRQLPVCSADIVNFSAGDSPKVGFAQIIVTVQGIAAMLTRDVLLSRDGNLLGRLVAGHQGNYSPAQLIDPSFNFWIGYVDHKTLLDGYVQLTMNMPAGTSRQCLVEVDRLTAATASQKDLSGVPGDV